MTEQRLHNESKARGHDDAPKVLGWREWLALPNLGIARVKAKIDTGAQTSSLHAEVHERFERDGKSRIRFTTMPHQRDVETTVECEAEIIGFRTVRSSTGHAEERPVIATTIEVCGKVWSAEITLADRSAMGFRMLLGREALRGRFLINPAKSFLASSNNITDANGAE